MINVRSRKILMLALADVAGNPRPRRLIGFCRARGDELHVVSLPGAKLPDGIAKHYPLRLPSRSLSARIGRKIAGLAYFLIRSPALREWFTHQRWGLKAIQSMLTGQSFDLVIVEDLPLLPFAFRIHGTAPILFDAREYFPEEIAGSLVWRITARPANVEICRDYLKRCNAVMTVSPGLVHQYEQEFGISCNLVRSMPDYRAFAASPPTGRIRMVHHGNASRDRKLETMIGIMTSLDQRFSLDFYLTGDTGYAAELCGRATSDPRIRFLPPVPFDDIGSMLNTYDIGLYVLQPTGFNTEYALPNKFFEFIQAGLCIAIGPSPDMAALVRQYDCGIVADSFAPDAMAARLNALDNVQLLHYREASLRAAKDLCFERESEKIATLIDMLVGADKKAAA